MNNARLAVNILASNPLISMPLQDSAGIDRHLVNSSVVLFQTWTQYRAVGRRDISRVRISIALGLGNHSLYISMYRDRVLNEISLAPSTNLQYLYGTFVGDVKQASRAQTYESH